MIKEYSNKIINCYFHYATYLKTFALNPRNVEKIEKGIIANKKQYFLKVKLSSGYSNLIFDTDYKKLEELNQKLIENKNNNIYLFYCRGFLIGKNGRIIRN